MKFGSDFSWLWVAIIRIFTAPFYLVLWCINVVKSAIGMFIFWIIAKICVTIVLIGGLAIIHHLFKFPSENIIDNIFKDTGMSETLGLISAKNIKPSLEMQQKLDQEKKETLDSCYENVKNVIKTNKRMFDKVLDVLMEKGTLTGEEFVKLVKDK